MCICMYHEWQKRKECNINRDHMMPIYPRHLGHHESSAPVILGESFFALVTERPIEFT